MTSWALLHGWMSGSQPLIRELDMFVSAFSAVGSMICQRLISICFVNVIQCVCVCVNVNVCLCVLGVICLPGMITAQT